MLYAPFDVRLMLISSHAIQLDVPIVSTQVLPEILERVIHKYTLNFETMVLVSCHELVHTTEHSLLVLLLDWYYRHVFDVARNGHQK